MLLARLQIERGGGGIETLARSLPYAGGNGEYQAFLAGALQRQGRHTEAVEQYQTALRGAPGNGVWWMGLGISLQANQRDADAQAAFRRAQAAGSLQAFVERKLQQLAR
jgi:MSHA biogenesis protein MshN